MNAVIEVRILAVLFGWLGSVLLRALFAVHPPIRSPQQLVPFGNNFQCFKHFGMTTADWSKLRHLEKVIFAFNFQSPSNHVLTWMEGHHFGSFPIVLEQARKLLTPRHRPVAAQVRSQPIYPGPEQSDSDLGARRLGGQLGKFLTASL